MFRDSSTLPNLTDPAVYEPRALNALPNWEIDQWVLKPYEISFEADDKGHPIVPPQLWGAAQKEARKHLRMATSTQPTYGAGFVVLHRSYSGAWLLTGWWAYDNILCSGLSHASDSATTFKPYKGPIRACVHELSVIEFERRAWIETMMTRTPDVQKWSERRLTEDLC